MPFAAALSQHPDPAVAAGEVTGQVLEAVGSGPSLAALFVSGAHVAHAHDIAATVQTLLEPSAFVGSSAAGVVCDAQGVEDAAAVALWAGTVRGALTPVHLTASPADGGFVVEGMPVAAAGQARSMLLLPDPFSFPVSDFLQQLATDFPNIAAIGGLASASSRPGGNRLVIGGRVTTSGAVGVLLDADATPRTVVSQGCRPIGQPWVVTKSEGNVIFELGGQPALGRVLAMVEGLGPEDRLLAAGGLHCGIVADEHKEVYERGDFLIRAVLGADRRAGAVAVGERVDVGSTVQFQVRDATTAGEDLEHTLGVERCGGALVFTCNGRGAGMFGTADHDPGIVHERLGAAIAGMFCAGEIGPVARRNALHGFTASVALFDD